METISHHRRLTAFARCVGARSGIQDGTAVIIHQFSAHDWLTNTCRDEVINRPAGARYQRVIAGHFLLQLSEKYTYILLSYEVEQCIFSAVLGTK